MPSILELQICNYEVMMVDPEEISFGAAIAKVALDLLVGASRARIDYTLKECEPVYNRAESAGETSMLILHYYRCEWEGKVFACITVVAAGAEHVGEAGTVCYRLPQPSRFSGFLRGSMGSCPEDPLILSRGPGP